MPAPSSPSRRNVVRTSCSRGTLVIETGSSASSAAHRIGSTAFFAPEMRTSPCSGWPPSTTILSISGACFAGRECLQRQGMDFPAHAIAERGVDHAMASEGEFAGERFTDDGGLEVHAIGAMHVGPRSREALLDQMAYQLGIHAACCGRTA